MNLTRALAMCIYALQNEGAPRSAAIERDSSSKSDGDVSSGAVWESPVGHEKSGGLWLVGRRIRTKRGDEGWCECKVVSFEASGHVVQVAAEEASKNCDLSSVKWEFDIKQGPAGQTGIPVIISCLACLRITQIVLQGLPS